MKKVIALACAAAMLLTGCFGYNEVREDAAHYVGTEEEIEQYAGSYYRSKSENNEDPDLYFLTLNKDGSAIFIHETRETNPSVEERGFWDVTDRGLIHIKLETMDSTFRFLENSSGATSIICQTGEDFVESGEDGNYASFVRLKWYTSDVKMDFGTDEDRTITVNVVGEGGKWFDCYAMKSDCRLELHSDYDRQPETVIKCRYAINQNSHLVILVTQLSE